MDTPLSIPKKPTPGLRKFTKYMLFQVIILNMLAALKTPKVIKDLFWIRTIIP